MCRMMFVMERTPLPRPTETELQLLAVLWREGPCTVRQIHDAVSGNGTGYTTTLKVLQRMTEKGLVLRDEAGRSHVYRAARREEETQRQLVRDLLQRAFAGSPTKLVLQALAEKGASAEDMVEIRRILDAMQSEQPKGDAK